MPGEQKSVIDCPCLKDCPRHALCDECVTNHVTRNNFPACFFSPEAIKAGDRSFEALVKDRQG